MKWKEASGRVLCDRRIPIRLNDKFYKTEVRPAKMYGSECWAIDKSIERNIDVVEIRMLR